MTGFFTFLSLSANLFSSAQQSWAVFNRYFYNICSLKGLPNYGFLITSVTEDYPASTKVQCVTWYKAYLILEVLENL